jgi:hypothetical protein
MTVVNILQYTYINLLNKPENDEKVKQIINFLAGRDILTDDFLDEARVRINQLKQIGEDTLYNELKDFPEEQRN